MAPCSQQPYKCAVYASVGAALGTESGEMEWLPLGPFYQSFSNEAVVPVKTDDADAVHDHDDDHDNSDLNLSLPPPPPLESGLELTKTRSEQQEEHRPPRVYPFDPPAPSWAPNWNLTEASVCQPGGAKTQP
jgi:hypothetical protein